MTAFNREVGLFTLEFVPNEDRITPPIPASFSLMMLGTTPAGDAYTANQWKDMLSKAGFVRTRLEQVPQSPQQLIVSTKEEARSPAAD